MDGLCRLTTSVGVLKLRKHQQHRVSIVMVSGVCAFTDASYGWEARPIVVLPRARTRVGALSRLHHPHKQ